jgi:hypothetical protein
LSLNAPVPHMICTCWSTRPLTDDYHHFADFQSSGIDPMTETGPIRPADGTNCVAVETCKMNGVK